MPYNLWGGYEEAERKIIVIGEKTNFSNFICALRITSHSGKPLSHRSILGSVLGLGVKREMVGDILTGDSFADVIVMENIKEFLENELKFVGREKVSVEEIDTNEIQKLEESGKEILASVSSLRLDSMISAGFGIAREKSSILIKGEAVKLNHVITKSATKQVKEGDLISVRGKRKTSVKRSFGTNQKWKSESVD